MKAELTAEKRLACIHLNPASVPAGGGNQTTDEDEGRVQVLVALFRVISVKLSRFFAVHGEEVGSGIVGPQRFEEFLEGGMEAGSDVRDGYDCSRQSNGTVRTTLDLSGRPLALASGALLPHVRTSPLVADVGRG
jgi:hypothetical protein